MGSLGVLIWQCISQTSPFGFAEEVTGADAVAIRELVAQGDLCVEIDATKLGIGTRSQVGEQALCSAAQ